MLSLDHLRPFGYRILVELLDPPEKNPAGGLWLPETADKRYVAPRLARVLKLPDGRGFSCHCESCVAVRETMHDLTQAPPDVDLRRVDLSSIAEGDIVLLQMHGGTAVDLRGSSVDLSRHGLAESPVKALLVLAHQVLAVVQGAETVTETIPAGLEGLQDLHLVDEDEVVVAPAIGPGASGDESALGKGGMNLKRRGDLTEEELAALESARYTKNYSDRVRQEYKTYTAPDGDKITKWEEP